MKWYERLRRWLLEPLTELFVCALAETKNEIGRQVKDWIRPLVIEEQKERKAVRQCVAELDRKVESVASLVESYAPFSPKAAKEWECVRFACEKYRRDPKTGTSAQEAVQEWAQHYAQEQGWTVDPESCLIMMSINILIYGPL